MEKVLIGPYEYSVEFVAHPISSDHTEVCGQIDYETQTVKINICSDVKVQRETLIHEIVHAIDYQYKLHLCEDDVDRIANGITEVLLRNPWIVEFLAVGK